MKPCLRPPMRVAALLAAGLLAGCVVTTQPLQRRDLPLPSRLQPATPSALNEVRVGSAILSFSSAAEQATFADGLRQALRASNLFGSDPREAYRLQATVLDYRIPLLDGGDYASTLVVHYRIVDHLGADVAQTTVQSSGRDDTGSLFALERSNRSRTTAVADNIYEFVQWLDQQLDPKRPPQRGPT